MITKSDIEKIEDSIRQAELRTQGEIVPVLLSRSDSYLSTNYMCALIFNFIAIIIVYFLNFEEEYYLYAMIGGSFLGYIIGQISSVKRFLIGKEVMDLQVHEKAMQLFLENNLHCTKDRNGILIMISLLEHRVEIVADRGINNKVKKGSWDIIVNELIRNIKKGEYVEGLNLAINECREVLERYCPAKEDNPNELDNTLITDLPIK